MPERRIHRQHAAGERAVVEMRDVLPDGDGSAPEGRARADGEAGAGGGIRDRDQRTGRLGVDRQSHHRRMDVVEIANELGHDFVTLESDTSEPGWR